MMPAIELKSVLEKHKKWLIDEPDGENPVDIETFDETL